ncbi:carboxyl methyltransferase [Cyanidiococcus yangmingshanensis]|uniref:Carboxyl methyltransferase n=1 Tax=Cyanidiococcus yangmingshanensis TaxID=2690220 RepID=A0A7J7IEN6_9RHOD|nr:carboxyl methyltransferase [Cyanidiococcus yangmingshanensis]
MFDVDYMLWSLVLIVFHLTEGLFAYAQHREPLSWRSMLFSRAYLVALVAATVEHELLRRVLSEWLIRKRVSLAVIWSISHPSTRYAGLMLCLVGEGIRKGSMWTLGPAFTHEIARERRMTHRLYQQGFYAAM